MELRYFFPRDLFRGAGPSPLCLCRGGTTRDRLATDRRGAVSTACISLWSRPGGSGGRLRERGNETVAECVASVPLTCPPRLPRGIVVADKAAGRRGGRVHPADEATQWPRRSSPPWTWPRRTPVGELPRLWPRGWGDVAAQEAAGPGGGGSGGAAGGPGRETGVDVIAPVDVAAHDARGGLLRCRSRDHVDSRGGHRCARGCGCGRVLAGAAAAYEAMVRTWRS